MTDFFLDQNNEQLIRNNNNINESINNPLSIAYLDLIKQLWINQDGNSSYQPSVFKNTLVKMNPLFNKNEIENAEDLIIFILNQLHKELKHPKNIIQNNNNQNIEFNFLKF